MGKDAEALTEGGNVDVLELHCYSLHLDVPCKPHSIIGGVLGRWLNYRGIKADLLLRRENWPAKVGPCGNDLAGYISCSRSSLDFLLPRHHDISSIPLSCPFSMLSYLGTSWPWDINRNQNKPFLCQISNIGYFILRMKKVTKRYA